MERYNSNLSLIPSVLKFFFPGTVIRYEHTPNGRELISILDTKVLQLFYNIEYFDIFERDLHSRRIEIQEEKKWNYCGIYQPPTLQSEHNVFH